jgi:pyruvate dehydrogenase E2 component (dihydrolipoamide acetyltransferase)
MAEVTMPKMGDAMEEGTILRWLKREGDRIENEEEPIAEIQTEKANIEIAAYQTGTLTRILVKEGETVAVGTAIAVLDGEGAQPAAAAASEAAPPAPAPAGREESVAPPAETPVRPPGGEAPPAPEAPAEERERLKASPLARKIAAQHGIDLAQLQGSGPGGRIVEADVEGFRSRAPAPAAPPAPAAATPAPAAPPAAPAPAAAPALVAGERPLTPMRKTIAKRLTESKRNIPHFYLTTDIDVGALVAFRGEFNALHPEDRRISFNDLVVKACALALPRFPALNSQLEGDTVRTLSGVHIGVAVALEEGLIVPVLRDCEHKSITKLAAEIREKATRARAGRLAPNEYSGGGFTISNLGMYDVEQFDAVINPPEAAILAVGSIRDAPVISGGAVVPGKRMKVTISVDHRIVDGATAAQFLQELKRLLQSPLSLLE